MISALLNSPKSNVSTFEVIELFKNVKENLDLPPYGACHMIKVLGGIERQNSKIAPLQPLIFPYYFHYLTQQNTCTELLHNHHQQ